MGKVFKHENNKYEAFPQELRKDDVSKCEVWVVGVERLAGKWKVPGSILESIRYIFSHLFYNFLQINSTNLRKYDSQALNLYKQLNDINCEKSSCVRITLFTLKIIIKRKRDIFGSVWI